MTKRVSTPWARTLAAVLACGLPGIVPAGPTEAAQKAASAAAPTVQKTEAAVKKGVKKAADAVEHGAKAAGSAVSRGAKKIGLPTGPAASASPRGELQQ